MDCPLQTGLNLSRRSYLEGAQETKKKINGPKDQSNFFICPPNGKPLKLLYIEMRRPQPPLPPVYIPSQLKTVCKMREIRDI